MVVAAKFPSYRAMAVGRSFSGLRALQDVDLTVEQGQIVGLIGPNGSGKTTLLNVMSGVLPRTTGRVFLGEVDISAWPAHRVAVAGVARTFQNIRLFGQMTVLENVEVGAALHARSPLGPEVRRAARASLIDTGLADVADRTASKLPYGVQRRVEIARALAMEPTFLLLDEPGAGANEAESDELRDLIAEVCAKRNLGMLVVEHDLRLIMRLANRIVVLNEGRRISEGTADEVRADPVVRDAYFGRRSD